MDQNDVGCTNNKDCILHVLSYNIPGYICTVPNNIHFPKFKCASLDTQTGSVHDLMDHRTK